MKKSLQKIILAVAAIFIGTTLAAAPAFADCTEQELKDGCVSTAILANGCACDNGSGSSVIGILNLVVRIMTIGVGVIGAIGITIVGIQYITAGGNEEQTRKAKRRMFEIVIGFVAYVLIFSVLQWLLPEFHPFS